jgi:hypothetical protein
VKDVFSEVRRHTVRGELPAGIISLRIKRRSEEVGELSIFPTKILLATDGSEAAELALHTAVALAKSTDSELHVLTAMLTFRIWTTWYAGILSVVLMKSSKLSSRGPRPYIRSG